MDDNYLILNCDHDYYFASIMLAYSIKHNTNEFNVLCKNIPEHYDSELLLTLLNKNKIDFMKYNVIKNNISKFRIKIED